MPAVKNPYSDLPGTAFWSPAVAKRHMLDIADLWSPKFDISNDTLTATFGSCFAQHFGRALVARGFSWFDAEPAPQGTAPKTAQTYNYGVFSARTGNIYTTSLLLQWTRWSLGLETPPDEVWETRDGRVVDPFRPVIEPGGFVDADEMRANRELSLEAFARTIRDADMFVFTLGLTESWWHLNEEGEPDYEYPMCPGTAGGSFDPALHQFENQQYETIRANLETAIAAMREANPNLKIMLTVSPVPLTATNSGRHVLVATMESKSILRAVAGAVSRAHDFVDYFPSYEIINAPPFKGAFFEPNLRSVSPHGVAHVMGTFFAGLGAQKAPPKRTGAVGRPKKSSADLVCEEEMLSAFGPSQQASAEGGT